LRTISEDDLVIRGIWIYALYRAMCSLNNKPAGHQQEVWEMLRQLSREATRGHAKARKIIEGRFTSPNSNHTHNHHSHSDNPIDAIWNDNIIIDAI